MTVDRGGSRPRWLVSVLLVAVVLVAGLAGSWGLLAAVDHEQRNHSAAVMDQRVEVIQSSVSAEVSRYTDTVADLAAAVGAQSNLTAADFATVTSGLSRLRLPGSTGAALVVPATNRQIPQLQRYWRAQGSPGLTLVPVGTSAEHLFVVLSHPLDGSKSKTGRDLSQIPEPTQAMMLARSHREVTISRTYVLLRDRGLPTAQQQLSFVLVAPVYAGTGTPDAGQFRGWLVMGLRSGDFLNETLRLASQRTVAVTLIDGSTLQDSAVPVAHFSDSPVINTARLNRMVSIQVPGRHWELSVLPTQGFSATLGPRLSFPAGAAGALFTLLLAVLVATLSTSRNRALTQVDKATAALRADIERREQVEAELREREEELHRMALTDSLTGLANRRAFLEQLDQAHARSRRHDTQLVILYGDVDHFKAINDTYGHTAGDAILCQVAARLRAHFRVEDTVGRLGGDEFAIICENFTLDSAGLVERLREVLSMPYSFRDQPIAATVSVGLASPLDGESSSHLLERADHLMYQAKVSHS